MLNPAGSQVNVEVQQMSLQVREKAHRQVREQVSEGVSGQVWNEVSGQVLEQVWGQVSWRVNSIKEETNEIK